MSQPTDLFNDFPAQPEGSDSEQEEAAGGLWEGDTGTLHEQSRRALLELLKGPYVSGAAKPHLWSALIADERAIRSRLNDLFLELVIDPADEFAFVRKVQTTEIEVPAALRTERLTFIDTAMLLVLRQLLLAAAGEQRVFVSQSEVYEQLSVYRTGDEATFKKNLNSAWGHMLGRFGVLHRAGEDRVEISPIVKFLVDDDRVRNLTAMYQRIAGTGSGMEPTEASQEDAE